MEEPRLGKHVDEDQTLEIMQFNSNSNNQEPVMDEDETDKRKNRAVEHLNKLKTNRRNFWLIIIGLILLMAIIYFVSPISKVNDINVVGGRYFSDKAIINTTSLDYGDYMIDVSTSKIVEEIKDHNALVSDVKVDKQFGGIINIELKVDRVVAYYGSGKDVKVLKIDGKTINLENNSIETSKIPYVSNMRESDYKLIAKQLSALRDDQLAMISEIRPFKNDYGVKMVEVIMNDGHMVRTEIDGIHLMKSYNKIMEKLNSNLRCINIIEGTNSAYSEKC